MMRRRTAIGLLAGVLLAGLVAMPGAPAGAQEFGVLEIDPDGGVPGDIVHTQLPSEVIGEHCTMSSEELRAELNALMGPGGNGETAFFDYMDEHWGEIPFGTFTTDPEAFAFVALFFTLLTIMSFPDSAQDLWEASFVLSFASLESELVGETSTFDPDTGEGEIVVPEVGPGLWAIAAVCLGWNTEPTADGTIAPAIAAGAMWVTENLEAPYPDFQAPEFEGVAAELAPVMLGADPMGDGILIAQGGPWVDLFCVWNAEGFCATPPGPVGSIDAVVDELDGEGDLGEDEAVEALLDALDTAGELAAVAATPTFTG